MPSPRVTLTASVSIPVAAGIQKFARDHGATCSELIRLLAQPDVQAAIERHWDGDEHGDELLRDP